MLKAMTAEQYAQHKKAENDRLSDERYFNQLVRNQLMPIIIETLKRDPFWQKRSEFILDQSRFLAGHLIAVHNEMLGMNMSNSIDGKDVAEAQRKYPIEIDFLMTATRLKNQGKPVIEILAELKKIASEYCGYTFG